jgi:hypothetical protein
MIFISFPLAIDEDACNGASDAEGEECRWEEDVLASEDGVGG